MRNFCKSFGVSNCLPELLYIELTLDFLPQSGVCAGSRMKCGIEKVAAEDSAKVAELLPVNREVYDP